jgi:hypothetical protein
MSVCFEKTVQSYENWWLKQNFRYLYYMTFPNTFLKNSIFENKLGNVCYLAVRISSGASFSATCTYITTETHLPKQVFLLVGSHFVVKVV